MVRIILCLGLFLPQIALAQNWGIKEKHPNKADSLLGGLRPENRCYDVISYHLNISLDTADNTLSGNNTISFRAVEVSNSIQIDLHNRFEIEQLLLENKPHIFRRELHSLFISLKEPLVIGKRYKLFIKYRGKPILAAKPPWDEGLVRRTDNFFRPFIGITCQSTGPYIWFPCKNHPSDKPDSVIAWYAFPKGLKVVGNGRSLGTKTAGKGYLTHGWKVSSPIHGYCVSFYAGNYQHIKDTIFLNNGSMKLVDYWLLDYNATSASKKYLHSETENMLSGFNELFGAYPYWKDGFKLVESPYWGMEHQSAIAYGNNFQINDFGFDFIIVHESGHEYWGNHVAGFDFADYWFHEAFCTYSESLLLEKRRGIAVSQKYLFKQRNYIKNDTPVLGPVGIRYPIGLDAYYKGAWMLHSLRYLVDNESLFISMFPALQKQFGNQSVKTDELIRWISGYLKIETSFFFEQFLKHRQLPVVEYYTNNDSLFYRLDAQVPGFRMPVRFSCSGSLWQKIRPTPRWRGIPLPIKGLPKPWINWGTQWALFEPKKIDLSIKK